MSNWQDLLKTNMDHIEADKALPDGKYHVRCGTAEQVTSSQKGTPGLLFPAHIVKAIDVDKEDLEAALTRADGTKQRLDERVVKGNDVTFWMTERALPMLKDFLTETLGLNAKGRQLEEVVAKAGGKEYVLILGQQVSDRGRAFNVVKGMEPLP